MNQEQNRDLMLNCFMIRLQGCRVTPVTKPSLLPVTGGGGSDHGQVAQHLERVRSNPFAVTGENPALSTNL